MTKKDALFFVIKQKQRMAEEAGSMTEEGFPTDLISLRNSTCIFLALSGKTITDGSVSRYLRFLVEENKILYRVTDHGNSKYVLKVLPHSNQEIDNEMNQHEPDDIGSK